LPATRQKLFRGSPVGQSPQVEKPWGKHFGNGRDSGTLPREVLVLFVDIESGPIKLSAAVGYV